MSKTIGQPVNRYPSALVYYRSVYSWPYKPRPRDDTRSFTRVDRLWLDGTAAARWLNLNDHGVRLPARLNLMLTVSTVARISLSLPLPLSKIARRILLLDCTQIFEIPIHYSQISIYIYIFLHFRIIQLFTSYIFAFSNYNLNDHGIRLKLMLTVSIVSPSPSSLYRRILLDFHRIQILEIPIHHSQISMYTIIHLVHPCIFKL